MAYRKVYNNTKIPQTSTMRSRVSAGFVFEKRLSSHNRDFIFLYGVGFLGHSGNTNRNGE